ncbi:hypothetical protein HPHPP23_1693 [Helicobacter pylori Hp P-23]|uniref:Uncharacterized protein n=1 Tax=Helicobacter pylori Hp P-15 TaxID=992080 RepID=I9WK03_HELPX|nr:hypothetical protein HPHPP15_1528 [Helicobacter pylori Hp P-15]EJC11173.1 hypothetical protein HPHPP23_1693 [Helicobacter pylori Hp P-23]EJC31842.1 hypothetical protein HPHPP15B_0662 [Helicobacter pylori Hp P-15b]
MHFYTPKSIQCILTRKPATWYKNLLLKRFVSGLLLSKIERCIKISVILNSG